MNQVRGLLTCCVAMILTGAAAAQTPLPTAQPVPRTEIVPQPYDQAAVVVDGVEVSRYHFGKGLNRPFLFPLVGPSGKSLTRMGHPRDPNSHSHHNSVWISHHDVNGVDFWGDNGKGRIVHRRVVRYEDLAAEGLIEVANDWQDGAGQTLLEENRRMRFIPLESSQWLLIIDLKLKPKNQAVTLGKTPFGLIGVRMAKTIGVHDGGGLIRNSNGDENEKGVFWKPAQWVDYSGAITAKSQEGITLFDHPTNPRHPTTFHVRDDGWMGAALTHGGAMEISLDKPLEVRYGLWVHSGTPALEEIRRQYDRFTKWDEPQLPLKPK